MSEKDQEVYKLLLLANRSKTPFQLMFGIGKSSNPYHNDAVEAVRNAGYEDLVEQVERGDYLGAARQIGR